MRPPALTCSLLLVLVSLPALAGCSHYAGVLKKYDEAVPIAGTEVTPADARVVLEIETEMARLADTGRLRGTAKAHVVGSLEHEVRSREVDAVNHYDPIEATLWRAMVAPFWIVFLQPIFGDGVSDYGGDGHVGVGDRIVGFVNVLNPLMAWPFGAKHPGEDRVLESRRERRETKIPRPPKLEVALTSHRGTFTAPVALDDGNRFDVDLLPAFERLWDLDLRGEIRDAASGRVDALRDVARIGADHLRRIGRLEHVEWAIAREADTRAAYERFRTTHAQSTWAQEVTARLDELEWREASAGEDPARLLVFARQHPTSPHAAEARVRIEEIAWQRALRADSIDGYTHFLVEHTDGDRAVSARGRLVELTVARDWQRAEARATPAAYREFVREHPSTDRANAVQERLAAFERCEAGWLAACAAGTAQAFRDYEAANPTSPYVPAAQRALLDLVGRDVVDLIEEGKVEAKTEGGGIQSVGLELRRLVPYPIKAKVPVGAYFQSDSPDSQNMVVTGDTEIDLKTDDWEHVLVPAACASKPLAIPGQEDTFTIRRSGHSADLTRLMSVLQKARADYATQQAAVWIVTDDPSWDGLGQLVSRPVGAVFGGTRVIDATAAARAIRLCADAGIAVQAKRILGDRQTFAPDVADAELKAWLMTLVPAPTKN